MILAYTKCVIIKNFQNRYFVLCTIISPACIQFQNLAKQTKVHCKYFFFNYCTFLYVGAKLCSVRRVLASFFVSQSSLLLLYIYFWVINKVETCFTLVVFLCSSHCGVFSRQVKKSTSQNISGIECNFFKWGGKVTPNFP